MMRLATAMTVLAAIGFLTAGCAAVPGTRTDRDILHEQVKATIDRAEQIDPGMEALFNESVGYVVFPTVGKGGLGIGAAAGRGEVYENGQRIGYASLNQATIGLQIGGQSYSEIIIFKTQDALNRFKLGQFELAAQASAVAVRTGASAEVDFEHGVAVFVVPKGGLMAEASIGGQKFSFVPLEHVPGMEADERRAGASPDDVEQVDE